MMTGLMTSLAIAVSLAQSTPIGEKWETDYATALHNAQADQRPLIVVLENPHNPTQAANPEALADSHGHPELLEEFELCRIDVTTKMGKKVAEAFGARQFPYTAITDQKCRKIVHREVGRPAPNAWVSMLASRVTRLRFQVPVILDNRLYSQENCFT
jgi:hypothetical protein